MPKDATATRANILAAAVQILQRGGIEGFTLDAVARRAGVGKGLILYHYASRGRLLRAAASQIATLRSAGIEGALASGSGAQFEDAAREAVIDGTAIALAAGVPLADAKDAYDALWLTLLEVTQKT